ncbi:MAG: PAS domain S-box protein [Spirochaetia bacterium]
MKNSHRESEDRYYVLFEQAGDAIFLIDPENGGILETNSKASSMLGYSKEELATMTVTDFDISKSSEQTIRRVKSIIEGKKRVFETQVICRGGTIIDVEVRVQPIKLAGKTVIQTILRDITEQKRMKNELKIQQERLTSFINSALDSIYLLDADLNFVEINNRGLEIIGKQRSDVIGKNIVEIVPDIGKSGRREKHLEVIRTGKPFIIEHFMPHPVFGRMHFLLKSFKVGDGLGVIAHDITDLVAAESRVRDLIEHTTDAIFCYAYNPPIPTDLPTAEIVRKLYDGTLIDCNLVCAKSYGAKSVDQVIGKKLTELFGTTSGSLDKLFRQVVEKNFTIIDGEGVEKMPDGSVLRNAQRLESLGILAGGIAHDFNNLLGVIFGYIDMAAETTKEKSVTAYLAKTLATIERARALTGQLLTFSKGGVPVKNIERLSPFIEETVRFALSGSNVAGSFSIPAAVWPSAFDKNQIGQVIDNIVINAVQAMPAGGPLEISAENITLSERQHATLPPGRYVKIHVKDHGIGMPKEILSKIFDPFFTTKEKGHGLGLATCYSILKRHGGCIEVESVAGKGSVFTIYLPAVPAGSAERKSRVPAGHKGAGTFLVLDDEEVIRNMIGDMLKAFGYSIEFTSTGIDAIEILQAAAQTKRKIAGCIFDLTIQGGLGGKDVIAKVREFDHDTPVFVTSGYADDPVMVNPEEYGFNGSIFKPFRKVELADLLNKHLNKGGIKNEGGNSKV